MTFPIGIRGSRPGPIADLPRLGPRIWIRARNATAFSSPCGNERPSDLISPPSLIERLFVIRKVFRSKSPTWPCDYSSRLDGELHPSRRATRSRVFGEIKRTSWINYENDR
jgi:hypothetical protein